MYKLENEDLSEKAYKAVKKMILRGELKPGKKLYQEKLADTLGISRTPLNSALNKLEKEMLVEALPRRGFYVKQLSLKELQDLYNVRLRLEPLGAWEAANNNHPALDKRCRELLESYSEKESSNSSANFKELDYGFHSLIMEMSGNVFLSKMISSYNIITLGNLQLFMDKIDFPKRIKNSIEEHKIILKAIIEGNAETAEQEMYRHIERACSLLAISTETGNYGKT